MRIPSKVSALAAGTLLLVAMAVALMAISTRPPSQASPPASTAEATASSGWMPCLYHVMIIHDVHWAAACMKNQQDTSADCTLPNELAAALNKALQESENFCARRGV